MPGRKSNGEGSIRQRPDGTWELRATLEDATGVKRRVSIYGATRKEVMAKRDAMKTDEAAGVLAAPNRHTVETYLNAWLDHAQQELKPTSHQSYKYLVDQHLVPRLGQIQLQKLAPLHVEGLITSMLRDGLSARTASYARAVLRRALQQALRWGLVGRNVAQNVAPPRKTQTEMQAWTPEQASKFLATAQADDLYALFYLALMTGLRRGELLGLRWQDVDEAEGKLHIRQNLVIVNHRPQFIDPKTSRSRRSVHVAGETMAVLRDQRARVAAMKEKAGARWQEFDLVFPSSVGTPLGTYTLNRTWRGLTEQAKLPRIRFHDLRHTYASLALAQKISPKVVSERLGHANVAFTLQTYAHVYEEEHRAAALDSAQLLAPKTKPTVPVAKPAPAAAARRPAVKTVRRKKAS
ncbi:tyrosine-type recombinase/integrase [Deinococcus multiflagellatus]|uniref:Tyrosine-type recombinase/integrase n=1 Tax=Deinococcus multiflagellatus TaxID=1656887 RepID=A0ABW1ZGZ0_9DEIO|nr:tyrosine-type recombinase/integrase [Deinococcus multiflagellatus]MBZ9713802.1 site-specific integrase [Deinococcus multiflagellatus]